MARSTGEAIAKKAGCSISTVSRVLNNSASVSPNTRQAVLEAVRSCGSVPKVLGRRARRKKVADNAATPVSGMVEILMVRRSPMETVTVEGDRILVGSVGSLPLDRFFSPEGRYNNSFYRRIVDGAVDELNRFKHRGVLNVAPSLADPQLLANVNADANRGLILLGDYGDDIHAFLRKVRCPVVSLVTWPHTAWPDYVGIDNVAGISTVFDHLFEAGHRKIGYVAGNEASGVFRERLVAFQMKMAAAGLPFRSDWVVTGTSHIGLMEPDIVRVLQQPDRPTAMMCCYDGAAVAVCRAAARLGLAVPQDLSVCGFDDEDIAELVSPPLTTVRVPTHEMGRRAVQLLMMRREAYGAAREDACTVRVRPQLVVRASTAAPSGAATGLVRE